MTWWAWVLLGIALLVVEVATPGGLFALFFGAGAIVVAPLAALGVPEAGQWLAFTVFSVASLLGLRRRLMLALGKSPASAAELVGEQAVVLAEVAPAGEGRVELRGTPWTARTDGGTTLAVGKRCRVERVEGLTLWIRAE
jgi:membrane protein implicated in regulation of membrane protease activity